MTIYEINNLPHVDVTFGSQYHIIKVEDGYYITAFKGGDYSDYIDYNFVYVPIKEEYEEFYVIDEKQHESNINNQLNTIEDYE